MKLIANKFNYLASCIALVKLLPISTLFYFSWVTSLNAQRPQPVPLPDTKPGRTRDGCLVVPLIPRGVVSKTSLARPVVWFYVKYPEKEAIPQVKISHKDVNGKTIYRLLELDTLNPTFSSYTLPDNQELNENETFRFRVQCGHGNSTSINIKRISASEFKSLAIIDTPPYATNLYKLDFWAESTNLILGTSRNSLCKDKAKVIELFTLMMNKLEGDQDKMRVAFQSHFDNTCK